MLGNVVEKKRGRRHNGKLRTQRKSLTAEDAEDSRKITEFFPVRRSGRKTSKQLEREEHDALANAIASGSTEKFLEVFVCKEKGRGIRSLKPFAKNEFVVEYKGDTIDIQTAKLREKQYAQDPSIGSYMYFFTFNNKQYCVDATEESPFKGRLINHSALRPNLKTKAIELNGIQHLILVAKRDIEVGEELLYDYGDRTPATVENNPWLVNS